MNANPFGKPRKVRAYLIALGAAAVIILAITVSSLSHLNPPPATTSTSTTTSASYAVGALSVISSAAVPAGYSEGSSQQLNPSEPGLENAGFAIFSSQTGSLGNLTVLVFDGPGSAQTYIDSVVTNAKGLIGYTDVSPALASYSHYGLCYGYGEDDPDGNGSVATGVCTRGNVYIQVHIVSHSQLAIASQEMANLVGAAYGGIG